MTKKSNSARVSRAYCRTSSSTRGASPTTRRRFLERERAVGTARHKVKEAALAVIRASDAVARISNDLETLQNEIIRRRFALRFLIGKDLVPEQDAAEIKRRMQTELPPNPVQPTFEDWARHPSHVEWADVLKNLQHDPDYELPA